jgi:hypothetical protein
MAPFKRLSNGSIIRLEKRPTTSTFSKWVYFPGLPHELQMQFCQLVRDGTVVETEILRSINTLRFSVFLKRKVFAMLIHNHPAFRDFCKNSNVFDEEKDEAGHPWNEIAFIFATESPWREKAPFMLDSEWINQMARKLKNKHLSAEFERDIALKLQRDLDRHKENLDSKVKSI